MWDYRIIYLGEDLDESIYGICEVYYDEDGNPNGRTDPVPVVGHNVGAVLWMMRQAFRKPILTLDLKPILSE